MQVQKTGTERIRDRWAETITHVITFNLFQPIDFIIDNNLDWCEANVVKYITRWRDKNGIEDLRKAMHYIQLLIEREQTM
jgi:hypothetical protein